MIRAVICDLDGLLFDSERRTRAAWQAAIASFGQHLDDDFYTALIGRKIAISEGMVANRFGIAVETFRERWRAEHAQLVQRGPVAPRPGAEDFIAWLVDKNIPRAIATSSIRADAEHTLGQRITHFPVVITGDQVQHGKPDPEIYLRAAAGLDIAPEHCAALEDSEPGVMAAHAAGMHAIMVPDLKTPSEAIRSIAHSIQESLLTATAYLQSRVVIK